MIIVCLAVHLVAANDSVARQAARAQPASLATIEAILSAPAAETDYARAKLTFDQMVDPTINIDARLRQIDQMVAKVRALAGPNPDDKVLLTTLRRFIYDSGEWNDNRPFAYDMTDPLGQRMKNRLLSTYLDTRRGNCVSMPMLYLILADRLGFEMSLSTAPAHVLLKYRPKGLGMTLNLEATSGSYVARDAHYRANFPMTDKAVANGVYLGWLTREENLAVIATVVLEGARNEKQFEKAIRVADVLLKHYPKYASAWEAKAASYSDMIDRDFRSKYRLAADIPPARQPELIALGHAQDRAASAARDLGATPIEVPIQ
ncbi:MAG: transglutaminase family protein [Micropepsaceae bacterium]